MSQPGSCDEHFRHSLGLFTLGALPLDEHLAVEVHLAQCAACRRECDELSDVPALLSLLSEEDIRALAVEFAPVERSGGSVCAGPPLVAAGNGGRRAEPRAGRGRGGRGRLAGSPSSTGRGRLLVAAITITLSVGVGIGAWLQASDGATTVPTTLSAVATDRVTGASVSIVVTGRDKGSHIEAVLSGLRTGVQYQLFAVTVHGRTVVVTRWLGADGRTTVAGDLDVAPQDLAFFTVAQIDGAVVVSAHFVADRPTR
jgi:hypothetical protein